jgi:hypothetical protein
VELRGPTFEADKITTKSTIIGEGNYGEVFQVSYTTPSREETTVRSPSACVER